MQQEQEEESDDEDDDEEEEEEEEAVEPEAAGPASTGKRSRPAVAKAPTPKTAKTAAKVESKQPMSNAQGKQPVSKRGGRK